MRYRLGVMTAAKFHLVCSRETGCIYACRAEHRDIEYMVHVYFCKESLGKWRVWELSRC